MNEHTITTGFARKGVFAFFEDKRTIEMIRFHVTALPQ